MKIGHIAGIAAIAAALGASTSCRSDRSVPAPNRHNVNGRTTTDTAPDVRDDTRSTDRSVDSAAPVPSASPARDDAGRINQSGADGSAGVEPRKDVGVDDAANSTAGPNSGGTRDKAPETTPTPVDPDKSSTNPTSP